MKDKLLIYEYDCMTSIFQVEVEILTKICSKIVIPQLVYDKFKNRMDENIKHTITQLISRKFVVLEDFDIDTPDYMYYKNLTKGIKCKCRGKCESAAITIAKKNKFTVISNNGNDLVDEFDIACVSVGDAVTDALNKKYISIEEAKYIYKLLNYTTDDDIKAIINHMDT